MCLLKSLFTKKPCNIHYCFFAPSNCVVVDMIIRSESWRLDKSAPYSFSSSVSVWVESSELFNFSITFFMVSLTS